MIPNGNASHVPNEKKKQKDGRGPTSGKREMFNFIKSREVSKKNEDHQDLVALYDN